MLNCRLVVDVGSDFDSLNFAPFRLPYPAVDSFDINSWSLLLIVLIELLT